MIRTEKENLICFHLRIKELGKNFFISDDLIQEIDDVIYNYKKEVNKNECDKCRI